MPALRSFSLALTIRITFLAVALAGCVVSAVVWREFGLVLLFAALAVWAGYSLYRYVEDTNRRLARFFESVRYSDFAVRFSSEKEKGSSFEELNRQFNEVLEAFRQTRAEKEANLLFLNTIVQHLSTGLLAFDARDGVLLSNNAAFQQLGVYRLHHVHDLPERHRTLVRFVENLATRGKLLYQPEPGRQLSVQGVHLNLQGRAVRLLTVQNIHPELQRKEVDAWRDLTRVLRHEIMNSVAPIVSLVETMQDIVRHDLPRGEATNGTVADLEEALDVVASRSRALVDFVQAYRSFTAIPAPKIADDVPAKRLLEKIVQLEAPDLRRAGVAVDLHVEPDHLTLRADAGQIEMVLINLIKNAKEALSQDAGTVAVAGEDAQQAMVPKITLHAGADPRGRAFIAVEDNGPGIEPGLLEEIFIPFFTTKPTGSGVGLSISRQIMQMHGGDLRVQSEVGKGTRFVLEF